MENYTANDIRNMFQQYQQHFQYVIVAHTKHRPYVATCNDSRYATKNTDKWLENKLEQTSKDLRYALNCFNRLLYPNATNKCRRNPHKYRPLTMVTIEGARATTDRQQTIHVNIALGNLPTVLNKEDIKTLFRHAWHEQAQQGNDIQVEHFYKAQEKEGWLGYSLKEAQQQPSRAWNENSIWDVTNCWIPHSAVNTD